VAFRLLDIVQYTFGVSVRDDATEVCSSIVTDPRAKNDGLGILLLKETEHGIEGERTADIRIEHKEPIWLPLENGITEVVETSSGAKSLVLAEILDLDVRELF
jgi:hypothetical protein